nr:transposase [Halomicroarcula sp. XH51]
MACQERRLTDAYLVGVTLTEALKADQSLCTALRTLEGSFNSLNDGYPEWHPAPHSFEGMVRLFLYRELTGESYRSLAQYPELAVAFHLEKIPDESVLSRTWRNRFDETTREFVTTASHYVVKEIHDRDLNVPEARPKGEVVTPQRDPSSFPDEPDEDESEDGFTDEQIQQTTRLARDHGFDRFDSGRAENASYDDTQFFELQTFMGMVGCGTPQGAARFQYRRGEEYGPHGDTHLRAIKRFEPEDPIEGFDCASEQLRAVLAEEASFRRSVTVAIDITTVPYHGEVEAMPMVSGVQAEEERAFKFATLSIVGENIPLVLAVEPIRESSAWDDNQSNQVHRVIRRMVRRANEHVPIETVLCDREFDSMDVYQTLSNLDVNYLIPKRVTSSERDAIETMKADGRDVAVERTSVDVEVALNAVSARAIDEDRRNCRIRNESEGRPRRGRDVLSPV